MRIINAEKRVRLVTIILLCLTLLLGSLTISKNVHAAAHTPYIGEIKLFPYGKAPSGWLFCAGQTLNLSQNTVLFSLLGNNFGGNGTTTFTIPDLRTSEPVDGVGYYIAISGKFPSADVSPIESILGEIRLFPYTFAPRGWMVTKGQFLPLQQNTALFSLIGTTYGGNGQSDFMLPFLEPIKLGINYYIATSGYFPSNNGSGSSSENFLGEILMLPYSYGSEGEVAQGQLFNITQNTALFSLLGFKFGGNGTTTFALPKLKNSNPLPYKDTNFYPSMYRITNNGIYPSFDNSAEPTAVNDSYNTSARDTLSVPINSGVLANDSGASSALVIKGPTYGSLTLNLDGSFSYNPNLNYIGHDSFTYKAYNYSGGSSTTTVSLSELSPTISGITDGAAYNTDPHILYTNGMATLNGISFTNNSSVSVEGQYTFTLTTPLGLVSTIHFSVDKTNPVVTGITEGESSTTSKTIAFNEGTATLDNLAFISGTTVSAQGSHTLVVTDAAGNSVTRHFTIAFPPSTVFFNSNGGSPVKSQIVNYNTTASEPIAPTKTGYTFAGWYSNSGLSITNNFGAAITGNITIYAKWTPLSEAVLSVATAEMEQTQISVNIASILVINLTSGLEKEDLLARLKVVQSIINNANIHIEDIVKLINEGTIQQKDVNQDNTFDYRDFQILLQRISAIN